VQQQQPQQSALGILLSGCLGHCVLLVPDRLGGNLVLVICND
jgi:hypothetical protein